MACYKVGLGFVLPAVSCVVGNAAVRVGAHRRTSFYVVSDSPAGRSFGSHFLLCVRVCDSNSLLHR